MQSSDNTKADNKGYCMLNLRRQLQQIKYRMHQLCHRRLANPA